MAGLRAPLFDLLWLLLPMAALLVLHVAGMHMPDAVIVVCWLLLATVVFAGLWRRARSRRRAFLNAYVAPGSPLRRWLRGGLLLAVMSLLQAMVLTVVLVVGVIRLEDGLAWRLLLLNLPLLACLHLLVRRLLAAHTSPAYLPELAWRVTLRLNFLLLFPLLALAALYASYPDLAGVRLADAVRSEAGRQAADSELLLVLMQLAAAKDALGWWLAQQLLPGVGEPVFRLLGWLLVFTVEGLFLWSYLLLASGTLTLVHGSDLPWIARSTPGMREERW